MEAFKKILLDVFKIILTIGTCIGFIFIVGWFIFKAIKDDKNEDIILNPTGEVKEVKNKVKINREALKQGVNKGLDILKNIQKIGEKK